MDTMCIRCARLTLTSANVVRGPARLGFRSFSTTRTSQQKNDQGNSGIAQSGQSDANAVGGRRQENPQPPKLVIRRTVSQQSSSKESIPQSSQSRRPASSGANRVLQRAPPQEGQVLRRNTPAQSGQVLHRTAAPGASPVLSRTRAPNAAGTGRSGARVGGSAQRQGQRSPQQNQKGPDRRRRKATKQEDDDFDSASLEKDMDDYVKKHIDRPANPTEPLPYNPKPLSLKDLSSDWPNTPLSTTGITESVVQKIEWLARRLPHGYQSPEQITEHYLKGNLTRFESEEEKQLVLKLASEMSAKTKLESEEGTLHKHETPRFQIVEDSTFTSLAGKAGDKSYLVNTGVKGAYAEIAKQKYPFLQNAARVLNNNETYGPVQMQKVLDRVQALIPQGKGAAAQQAKKS